MTSHTSRGDAAYPKWMEINKPVEFIYKTPIRATYFLFSPLPWDIKKIIHLIGMIDGFFYMFIIFLIFRNRKTIFKDPGLRNIAIILVFYFLVFGIGVGNFRSGLRHRAKFLIGLVLLAAPWLPKIVLFKKKSKDYSEIVK